ncbi:MAG: DUF3253 domain-containing protein [Deltaproteobacteria bacterium]|nr:DUF3253 domain-containing protein [Deltaproteobacteria bacterium]
MPKKKKKISDEAIVETIIQMCAAAGRDSVVRPEDVAQELFPEEWQTLLSRIRLTARQLTEAGHIQILRKGKPVDPNDFKGVYRLRISESFFEPLPE